MGLTFKMAASRLTGVVRQFSTSTVRSQLVQAPIQVFGIEGRYAHALYSAASKQKALDVVEKDLKGFQALLAKDTKFAEFVANPSVQRAQKKQVLETVLAKQKFSPLTVNLVAAIAENGRVRKLDAILDAFGRIMSAHRGEVICSVTTAKPLDKASLKDLEGALGGFLKKGEKLFLETKVDPSIIGGMVVTIGDKFVDMSMASKIKTYTNLIKESV